MAKGKKTASEDFTFPLGDVAGKASCGLPFFYEEFGTAEVEGIGTVRIGVAVGGGCVYFMLPDPEKRGLGESPPTLFSLPVKAIVEAALPGVVERFKSGVPAPFEEVD